MSRCIIKSKNGSSWMYFDYAKNRKGERYLKGVFFKDVKEATVFDSIAEAKSAFEQALEEISAQAQVKVEKGNQKGGKKITLRGASYRERSRVQVHLKTLSDEQVFELFLLSQSKENYRLQEHLNKWNFKSFDSQSKQLKVQGAYLALEKKYLGKVSPECEVFLKEFKAKSEQERAKEHETVMYKMRGIINEYAGSVSVPYLVDDFVPQWVQSLLAEKRAGKLDKSLQYETVVGTDDLLGNLQMWYVRSEHGWLGVGDNGTTLTWKPLLHLAKGFWSKDAALSSVAHYGEAQKKTFSLVRTQVLLDAVEPMVGGVVSPTDMVSCELASAFEAKSLESLLQHAVQERKEASLAKKMQEQGTAIEPSASREEECVPEAPKVRARL